jgi:ketosteroid isomerase-like protein
MHGSNYEEEIIYREKEWMNAWMAKDRAVFMEMLSDDFLLSSARGNLMTKKEWIENAMGPFNCKSFTWKEIKVRTYGNTAVVNSLVEQEATVGVKDWSGIFMLTDVWVNQNGKWQVVSRQGTGPLARQ